MLSAVEGAAKRGGYALNSHGNYIVDHGKSWKNHGIVFLNFCGNPVYIMYIACGLYTSRFYKYHNNFLGPS